MKDSAQNNSLSEEQKAQLIEEFKTYGQLNLLELIKAASLKEENAILRPIQFRSNKATDLRSELMLVDESGNNALILAAKNELIDELVTIVRAILSKCYNEHSYDSYYELLQIQNSQKNNLLHEAIINESFRSFEIIVASMKDIDNNLKKQLLEQANQNSESSISLAIKSNFSAFLRTILAAKTLNLEELQQYKEIASSYSQEENARILEEEINNCNFIETFKKYCQALEETNETLALQQEVLLADFIDQGININYANSDNHLALTIAVENKQPRAIKFLLNYGAYFNEFENAFSIVSDDKKERDIAEIFLLHKQNLFSHLIQIAEQTNNSLTDQDLDQFIEIMNYWQPLDQEKFLESLAYLSRIAAKNNNLPILNLTLDLGVNPLSQDLQKRNVLDHAIIGNAQSTFSYLFQYILVNFEALVDKNNSTEFSEFIAKMSDLALTNNKIFSFDNLALIYSKTTNEELKTLIDQLQVPINKSYESEFIRPESNNLGENYLYSISTDNMSDAEASEIKNYYSQRYSMIERLNARAEESSFLGGTFFQPNATKAEINSKSSIPTTSPTPDKENVSKKIIGSENSCFRKI